MTKPFQTQRLLAEMSNLLSNRQRVQEAPSQTVTLAPLEVPLNQADAQLLREAMLLIEEHIADGEFKVEDLAKALGLSRSGLYERIKDATGNSVAQLIRDTRMTRAQQLLRDSKRGIAEISERVGFNNPGYFRKVFSKEHGVSLRQYRKAQHSS